VLAAISKLEVAASELRRAVLTGSDTAEAGRRLGWASTSIRDLLPDSAPDSPPPELPERLAATTTPPVTESVTEPAAESLSAERAPRPADREARRERGAVRPPRSVTKPITKRDRPPRIEPSTVRVERNRNDYGPTWLVVAGDTGNPTLVGYVEAARTISGNRNSDRWIITTSHLGARTSTQHQEPAPMP
jgi:hypothetical protein